MIAPGQIINGCFVQCHHHAFSVINRRQQIGRQKISRQHANHFAATTFAVGLSYLLLGPNVLQHGFERRKIVQRVHIGDLDNRQAGGTGVVQWFEPQLFVIAVQGVLVSFVGTTTTAAVMAAAVKERRKKFLKGIERHDDEEEKRVVQCELRRKYWILEQLL